MILARRMSNVLWHHRTEWTQWYGCDLPIWEKTIGSRAAVIVRVSSLQKCECKQINCDSNRGDSSPKNLRFEYWIANLLLEPQPQPQLSPFTDTCTRTTAHLFFCAPYTTTAAVVILKDISVDNVIKLTIHSSCEIEDFV